MVIDLPWVRSEQTIKRVESDGNIFFTLFSLAWFVTEEGSWSKWKVEYN